MKLLERQQNTLRDKTTRKGSLARHSALYFVYSPDLNYTGFPFPLLSPCPTTIRSLLERYKT